MASTSMSVTVPQPIASRVRTLTKLVIKAGRKYSDVINVDLYELKACKLSDNDAVQSAIRTVVEEVGRDILDEINAKELIPSDQSRVKIRGLGNKEVDQHKIAPLTIGRALQDEFEIDGNNATCPGVVDWAEYGLGRSDKDPKTAVISIDVTASVEAGAHGKAAARAWRMPRTQTQAPKYVNHKVQHPLRFPNCLSCIRGYLVLACTLKSFLCMCAASSCSCDN